jgi:quinol-cytochrome oxidoreductase complex cytochrome b subunit
MLILKLNLMKHIYMSISYKFNLIIYRFLVDFLSRSLITSLITRKNIIINAIIIIIFNNKMEKY